MITVHLSGLARLRLETVLRSYEKATMVERRIRSDVARRVSLDDETRRKASKPAGDGFLIDLQALETARTDLHLGPEECRQTLACLEAFSGYQDCDEWVEDLAAELRSALERE